MHQTKRFVLYFTIILAIELVVVSNLEWQSLRFLTKPLVVGSLLFFFLNQKTEKRTKILVSAALLCTLLGDIQLIKAGEYRYLFIGGLVAFLIAKIVYIIEFSRNRNKAINSLIPSLILLVYGGSLFWYLHDSLGELIIPVALYMTTAWVMILFAYLRKDALSDNGYIYVLTGSLLLMLSASIVAITRFKSDIPFSGVFVMGIHGISQLLLVFGILMSDPIYKSRNQANESA